MVQVGLNVPTAAPGAEPNTAVEFGRRAELAGVHSVWVLDRLVFGNQEPLLSLAAIAATTERVRLGTCVLLATLRPPALLAKMIASLDRLSGGRVTLGVGVGSRPDDFQAAEVPFDHRGSRAEELVRVLRLAWSGAPVRHSGKFYRLDVGPIGPEPVQTHLPIWFGGSAESALKRIARIADGYIGGSGGGPSGFRANWEKVRRYADAAGRDPAAITPAALVYACVDDDRDRARAKAEEYLMHYYGPRRTDTSGFLLGPPDDCVRTANAYIEAGVQTLILGSVTSDLRYLERLCEHVLPRLPAG